MNQQKTKSFVIMTIVCIWMCMSSCEPMPSDTVQDNPVSTVDPQEQQAAPQQESTTPLPSKFFVKEKFISFVTSFTIKDENGTSYGDVTREILNLTTTFAYEDGNGKLVAKGKEKLLSWGTQIDFYDAEENSIGAIHENVFKSLSGIYTSYNVFDKNGKEIGKSDKIEMLKAKIIIKDNSGKLMAKIERRAINIGGDRWTVDVYQKDKIDTRILPIIAAYKTYSDNQDDADDD